MKLSKRLELVASFVPGGSRVADIGTDHGYIPIYLTEEGICPEAIAMDIGEGPLCRAREHIRQKNLEDRIQVRLSDGLQKLCPGEADTVVIAGMGGQLMIHILEEGRHVWETVKTWVLSPQSEPDKVRRYLEQEGFAILQEAMTLDEGKYYTVMGVSRGRMQYRKEWEYLYGRLLIEARDPVLLDYLNHEELRLQGIQERLREQDTPGAEAARKNTASQLDWIKEARDAMQ